MKRPAIERLMERVSKTRKCWQYTGYTTEWGYGRLCGDHGKNVYAHVLSYTHFIGPVPAGKNLDHLCRNPRCVRPEHLEPVTQRENVRRGIAPAAINARATHCLLGHPFSAENTIIRHKRNGVTERVCKICRRRRNREFKARVKSMRLNERAA